jgi:hypothetical protein
LEVHNLEKDIEIPRHDQEYRNFKKTRSLLARFRKANIYIFAWKSFYMVIVLNNNMFAKLIKQLITFFLY